jgi:hypothetical protein
MSSPPPSSGSGSGSGRARAHGHKHSDHHPKKQGKKHPQRPEGSRHSSDWLSRLHRRHDTRHHPHEDEAAPLLTPSNDDPEQGHSDMEAAQSQNWIKRVLQSCVGAVKNILTSSATTSGNAAKTTGRAAKNAAKAVVGAIANNASKAISVFRRNPKASTGTAVALLFIGNIVLGTMYSIHLISDKKHESCSTPGCIRASNNLLQNLHHNARADTTNPKQASAFEGSVNPCTEFDKFVCGGFHDRYDLASDQGHIDTRKRSSVALQFVN